MEKPNLELIVVCNLVSEEVIVVSKYNFKMATVLSTGQKVGGVVAAGLVVSVGVLCLIGGAMGWFRRGPEMVSEKQASFLLFCLL